jgi:50S ribosomal subunit-associated GTPase HflX
MTTATITLRVSAAERDEIAARAERDKVSLSDYIRVRLGLRGEGPQDVETTATEDRAIAAQLADHEERLSALEADRARNAAAR